MKNGIRVAICVMLVVAVLAMSLSVFAYDYGDRVVAWESLWAYYIYVFLDSIGIEVKYQDVIGYTDEVQDTIIDWVINYIADLIEADSQPSNYSIAQWIAPWQAEYDYWGNLQFNSTMLDDMQDFANWLKDKLSLTNNSIIVVNPEYSFGGYNLYELNKWYAASRLNGEVLYVNMEVNPNNWSMQSSVYWMPVLLSERGYIEILAISENNFYVGTTEILGMLDNGDTQQIAVSASLNNAGQGFYGYSTAPFWVYGMFNPQNYKPLNSNYFMGNRQQFAEFIRNSHIDLEGDVRVLTSNIVLPVDNPDYAPGDGMVIVDGVPQYGEVTFSGVIENLPAIVSTGTVSNPGLDTFWGFIPVLAEQTKDAIVLTRGLIYELPEELVVTFYAVMGGLILFGIIKLMREH